MKRRFIRTSKYYYYTIWRISHVRKGTFTLLEYLVPPLAAKISVEFSFRLVTCWHFHDILNLSSCWCAIFLLSDITIFIFVFFMFITTIIPKRNQYLCYIATYNSSYANCVLASYAIYTRQDLPERRGMTLSLGKCMLPYMAISRRQSPHLHVIKPKSCRSVSKFWNISSGNIYVSKRSVILSDCNPTS